MNVITEPGLAAVQMSGTDPEERLILSVLAKRTYYVASDRRLYPADEQIPLNLDVVPDPDNPALLAADADIYAYKVATDVVVKGHAYNFSRAPSFDATVHVDRASRSVRVFGDRRCHLGHSGEILFSPPGLVDRVPLRYDLAYGGRDVAAQERHGNAWAEFGPALAPQLDPNRVSPFDYPRNPAGRGYLVEKSRDAVDRLLLPNLEDPQDLLTAERMVAGDVRFWPYMPLPTSLDWVDIGWFPRVAYLGAIREFEPLARPVPEVARGYAPPDLMEARPLREKFSLRLASGASLGLQLPYLRGDEWIGLENLSPAGARVAFQLPGERPRIWIDGRSKGLTETQPVLHTVVIDADAQLVSVVWRGSAPALRVYMEQELATMPLRVEWPR